MSTLTTMYAGKINSPATTLDGAITNIATTISVADASVFPAAPNIAVIGNGATAETILYGGISSNDLTSVTREFQGDKIGWSDGTTISRNFTAYDYDTHRTNLGTLNTDKYESGSSAALAGIVVDGNKNVTPGDGAMIHVDTSTITDNNTSGSGTAAKYTHVALEAPTLAATNSSVTTSDVATLYINNAATAGTNQTITRNWAIWVDAGNARFDGSIYSGTTEALNSSGLVTVANQSNITGVSTITSGTWEGTTVAVAQGGTGATTLTDLITLGTHTTGHYAATITAGTGLTSTGATSGEGVAHSLSVDASQGQITTVGTIGAGTWEATDVAVAHGGTGVSTLTDGGVLLGSDAGAITAMAVLADSEMIVGDGSTDPVAESGATLRTSIGVSIGSDVQAYDAELAAIAGLTSAANKIPMFSGSGSASLIDFKDEDAMGSNSATAVASQQSVKAYADTKASAGFSVAMAIAL